MPQRFSDELDNDRTDELPVLLETVEDGENASPDPAAARAEDTGEHTALYHVPAGPGDAHTAGELAARVEQIPALEAQIRVLTDSARDLERAVAAKDRRISELEDALAALRQSADAAAAAERRAAAQLAVRDGRIAELVESTEKLRGEAQARADDLARLHDQAEAARRESEALRRELVAAAKGEAPASDADRLREDNAALAAYIAGRRDRWDELEATKSGLVTRVSALEREIESRDKRLAAADNLAVRESQRAVALRAELIEHARRVESLERELKLARGGAAAPEAPSATPLPPAVAHASSPRAAVVAVAAAEAAAVSLPVLTDAVGTVPAGVEALAQLEAEVEYKRQQVAAQLVELRERDQRLRAAAIELEQARRDLAALRGQLDDSRASVARLERTLLDKDRAIEARDARVATLQAELQERLGSAERRATDIVLPVVDSVTRAAHEEHADGTGVPVLFCLTGDAPTRFALTKRTVTVGRGPQCDLQILTHFVSREHARLTSQGGVTLIEDLGSRNGVFVNSVRVDRRHLQQGDLVTIGETQFRFVESVAH